MPERLIIEQNIELTNLHEPYNSGAEDFSKIFGSLSVSQNKPKGLVK